VDERAGGGLDGAIVDGHMKLNGYEEMVQGAANYWLDQPAASVRNRLIAAAGQPRR